MNDEEIIAEVTTTKIPEAYPWSVSHIRRCMKKAREDERQQASKRVLIAMGDWFHKDWVGVDFIDIVKDFVRVYDTKKEDWYG